MVTAIEPNIVNPSMFIASPNALICSPGPNALRLHQVAQPGAQQELDQSQHRRRSQPDLYQVAVGVASEPGTEDFYVFEKV